MRFSDDSNPKVVNLGLNLGTMAEKIETYFKVPVKVTIIVRDPENSEADVLVTNDSSLDEVISLVERSKKREVK